MVQAFHAPGHQEGLVKKRRKKRAKLKAPSVQRALRAKQEYSKLAAIPIERKTNAQVVRTNAAFKEWHGAMKRVVKDGLESEYRRFAPQRSR